MGLFRSWVVRKEGFEPPSPFGHTLLRRERLPFRHFRGTIRSLARSRPAAYRDRGLTVGHSTRPGTGWGGGRRRAFPLPPASGFALDAPTPRLSAQTGTTR